MQLYPLHPVHEWNQLSCGKWHWNWIFCQWCHQLTCLYPRSQVQQHLGTMGSEQKLNIYHFVAAWHLVKFSIGKLGLSTLTVSARTLFQPLLQQGHRQMLQPVQWVHYENLSSVKTRRGRKGIKSTLWEVSDHQLPGTHKEGLSWCPVQCVPGDSWGLALPLQQAYLLYPLWN